MDLLVLKKEWIVDQERTFARDLAREVIEIPKLSLWMILIPILLVYHIYQHNKAAKGRSDFAEHYLLSRLRSLEETCDALAAQRPPDPETVVALATELPPSARSAYRNWISVLMRHYADLLQAHGADFRELVVAVYRSRSNLLLHLNQVNRLEKSLNAALKGHVAGNTQSVADTITRIETRSADLRRRQAETLFP